MKKNMMQGDNNTLVQALLINHLYRGVLKMMEAAEMRVKKGKLHVTTHLH